MTTRYKRTLRRRFWNWCDDLAWTWNRHGDGFVGGFLFGMLMVLVVFEIVWSV